MPEQPCALPGNRQWAITFRRPGAVFPYCLLPTAYCLLPTPYCLLPTAYCLLPTAYCLLPIPARSARRNRRRVAWNAAVVGFVLNHHVNRTSRVLRPQDLRGGFHHVFL